jgi:hypothetical protein
MQTFEENESTKEVMELFTGILAKMYEQKETGLDKKYPDAENYLDSIREQLDIPVAETPE